MEKPFFCSEYTRELGTPLAGSIKPFEYLFMLEYGNTFGEDPIGEADMPIAVKEHLQLQIRLITQTKGRARLLLIRNQQTTEEGEKSLFVLRNHPTKPFVRRYTIESYKQLLRSPMEHLIDEDGGEKVDYPMYLVCTNGRKDKCCAKYGFPLYRKLYSEVDEPEKAVWQSSHVGGHRFAANVVTLPNGVYYGQVELEDTTNLIQMTSSGLVWVDKMRGRSSLPQMAQVGEYHLRKQHPALRKEDFEMGAIIQDNEEGVSYRAKFGPKHVIISLKKTMVLQGGSCASPEPKEGEILELVNIQNL
ncbi:MAG: sucrase ferredoxin [Bacteroidota bacterium]